MSARFQAIVWIDHRTADVLHLNATEQTKVVVNSHASVQALHHRDRADGSAHEPVDDEFFARIVAALNHTGGTLIAGPGEAKFEFERYLRRNRPDLAAHVHGLEILDRPGDARLVAIAREYFKIQA